MRTYLEITNACNRHCSFCPGTKREKIFVSPAVIRQRLEKLHGVDEICLHLMGEPLLHPAFSEIAAICRTRGIPVTLTTNGTLLNDSLQRVILENPVFRQINFSLQALNAGELSILDTILDFCRQALECRPELYLNLRMWNLSEDFTLPEQSDPFLKKIFETLNLTCPAELKFNPKWRSLNLKGRLYLHCNPVFEWPAALQGEQSGKMFCQGMISQFGILADGTVVPCCLDSEGEISLGNIDRQDLDAILQSPRADAIRRGFRQGIAVENLCRRCTFRRSSDKTDHQ